MRYGTFCAALLISLTLLVGCAAHRIEQQTAALQKHANLQAHCLDEITPTDKPLHGNALILIPSDVEIAKNYLGPLYSASYKCPADVINFFVAAFGQECQFVADTIRKRQLFDSASVMRHNGNPACSPSNGYDFVIYRDVDGWFLRGKTNQRALPLLSDKFAPHDAVTALAFLTTLYQQANSMRNDTSTP